VNLTAGMRLAGAAADGGTSSYSPGVGGTLAKLPKEKPEVEAGSGAVPRDSVGGGGWAAGVMVGSGDGSSNASLPCATAIGRPPSVQAAPSPLPQMAFPMAIKVRLQLSQN
jgi:hypothetical protein